MTLPIRHLLIAEDDGEQMKSWRLDVMEFNKRPDRKFSISIVEANSKSEAIQKLATSYIDCAVLDLRLPESAGSGVVAEEGNDLRTFIEREYPIPAVIHSAHPEEADEAAKSSLMKVFKKEAGQSTEALAWLAEKEPLMSALSMTSRRIREETAQVFHKAIWPRWDSIDKKSGSKEPKNFGEIITRQIISHLAEYLSIPGDGVAGHHLQEVYYIPPMRERLHTGDLIRIDNDVHVIVTPQCDMVNGYPANILLAKCASTHAEWVNIENLVKKNGGKIDEKIAKKISLFSTQGREARMHFLPPCGNDDGPWFVDFKAVVTVPSSDEKKLLDCRIASIAAPFVPNLVHRFASFVGRIGQPELDVDVLAAHLVEAVQKKAS